MMEIKEEESGLEEIGTKRGDRRNRTRKREGMTFKC